MVRLRLVAITCCTLLLANAPLLGQVYDPPGPPPDQSPLIAWAIAAVLFAAVLIASMKSAKRGHQD